MRVASTVSRYLLGLLFVLYGTNGFLRLGHTAPFATAIGREYMAVMLATPYEHILFALQVACGILLLCNRFVPVVLTVLAAYLFNIYMFHLFLDPSRSGSTVVATALWIVTFLRHRPAFTTLVNSRAGTIWLSPYLPGVVN